MLACHLLSDGNSSNLHLKSEMNVRVAFQEFVHHLLGFGDPGAIRTRDPQIRNLVLI